MYSDFTNVYFKNPVIIHAIFWLHNHWHGVQTFLKYIIKHE